MHVKPGIYYNLPAEKYFEAEGLNSSSIDYLLKSPAHYKAYQLKNRESTPSMIYGSALHMRLLEPIRYEINVLPHKLKTPKESDGKIYLHEQDLLKIEDCYKKVKKHPIAGPLLDHGVAESSLFWKDTAYEFLCKARIDYLRPDLHTIIDIKTCNDATNDAFSKAAYNYNYHLKACWYETGLKVLGLDFTDFLFICIEKDFNDIKVYRMPELVIFSAQSKLDEARKIYAKCVAEDVWPSYEEKIETLYLPPWASI